MSLRPKANYLKIFSMMSSNRTESDNKSNFSFKHQNYNIPFIPLEFSKYSMYECINSSKNVFLCIMLIINAVSTINKTPLTSMVLEWWLRGRHVKT